MDEGDQLNITGVEKKKVPWREFFLYLVVGFGSYILSSLVAGLFISEISMVVLALIALLNVLSFVGTAYLVGVLRGKTSWAEMGFFPPQLKVQWLLLAALASAVLIPIRGIIGIVFQLLVSGNMDSLDARADLLLPVTEFSWSSFLISLLAIAVLVPIGEEVFFRGLLYRWFRGNFKLWPSILLSATIFGLAHFDSIGVVASSFIMGIANAYAYEETGSLWVPITMHAVTNGFSVVVIFALLAFGISI